MENGGVPVRRRRRYKGYKSVASNESSPTLCEDDIVGLMGEPEVNEKPAAKGQKRTRKLPASGEKKERAKKSGKALNSIVTKTQKKRKKLAHKQAQRRAVADELHVSFKETPMEDLIETIENQATRHWSSIKAIGHDLDQLVGEAGQVGVFAQSITEKLRGDGNSQYDEILQTIEKQLDKLTKLALTLREQQNALATRHASLAKRQTEVEERTCETQRNIILLKLAFGALQQQSMIIAGQTACGNPSYMSKVHQSGMTLLPTTLS